MNRRAFLAAIAGAAVLPQVPAQNPCIGIISNEGILPVRGIISLDDLTDPNYDREAFRKMYWSNPPKAHPFDSDTRIWRVGATDPWFSMRADLASRNRVDIRQIGIVEFRGKRFAQWIGA